MQLTPAPPSSAHCLVHSPSHQYTNGIDARPWSFVRPLPPRMQTPRSVPGIPCYGCRPLALLTPHTPRSAIPTPSQYQSLKNMGVAPQRPPMSRGCSGDLTEPAADAEQAPAPQQQQELQVCVWGGSHLSSSSRCRSCRCWGRFETYPRLNPGAAHAV